MKLNWFPIATVTGLLIYQVYIVGSSTDACCSKLGSFNQSDFTLHSCAWCYYFLFQNKPLTPSFADNYLTVIFNSTKNPEGTKLVPDITNSSSVGSICSTLSDDECNMWVMCCKAANSCCERQLQEPIDPNITQCSSTWDGFRCWDASLPGTKNRQACPSFIKYSIPTRSALKVCQSDGTWLRKENREWTDYTPCLNFQELRITIYLSLGCQLASLTLLIPALVIFLHYNFTGGVDFNLHFLVAMYMSRSLRRQNRIRLHINFFLSFILSGIFVSMWNLFVTFDKLTNPVLSDTLLNKNLPSCKVLSFLKMYFTSTNYVWMFCEGFYLYRLIANAFSPPKRLVLLYIAGWGIPFLYSMAYAILRLVKANESCWTLSMGAEEWMIYTPNLGCLIANVCFLCIILRILVSQLQAHPNEPSSFRRALKAMFVLIPLFGVQLFVTIFRVPPEAPGALHYERFSEVISNSQGFVVALIFCFCNTEVSTQIKRSWRHVRFERLSSSRKLNHTLTLNFNNSVSQRTSDHHIQRRGSYEPCLKTDNISPMTIQSQF